ncbi:hypothetical protein NDU88_006564 [Pleurodeles waltl]|uniref:Uncharacterized protein n=1 Tax=Pleurodeles waltl TaxID=8319 RepID=A0AAV7SQ66_PLEWA|nr:hypothetical protein NDU88_006564 [Pleurodeles waltl]
MLARLKKTDREHFWVLVVVDGHGALRTTNASIAETFADYYEGLYVSETSRTANDCSERVGEIDMPIISEEESDALEVDLSAEELAVALQSLQSGAGGKNPVERASPGCFFTGARAADGRRFAGTIDPSLWDEGERGTEAGRPMREEVYGLSPFGRPRPCVKRRAALGSERAARVWWWP